MGSLAVLRFKRLHLGRALLHFFRQSVQLRVQLCALLFHGGELTGQYQPKLGSHFIPQASVTLRLGSLSLQRVHLPRDFLEDIIHPVQVELGIFQPGFREPLLGLKLRDSGSFFKNVAAVCWTAAQDLPDSALLNQRVRLRPEAGAHEQFLNIAQPAKLAVQQIFAIPRAEQPPRDHNLSRAKLLLVEFAAANLQNYVASRAAHRRRLRRRCYVMHRKRKNGFVLRERNRNRVDL